MKLELIKSSVDHFRINDQIFKRYLTIQNDPSPNQSRLEVLCHIKYLLEKYIETFPKKKKKYVDLISCNKTT